MPGGRRKWTNGHAGWRIQWVDGGVFKVEQEGDGLTDALMEEWGSWMDQQFDKRFGAGDWPHLTASTLNFSRNELGDAGVQSVVEYLKERHISVQMVKFFKNGIMDGGAWAIGQLLAHCREPVHEVHLSHNRITEQGACAIFEAIARSKRYPYPYNVHGRRENRFTPVWLRMEYNCIQWTAIEHRLAHDDVRWTAAESRDGWTPKDGSAPSVCMHASYKNQKLEVTATHGLPSPQATAGLLAHAPQLPPEPLEENPDGDDAAEEVPMYVFLDASAVRRFAADRSTAQERLFTFQGLLNLCSQGHMKCTPPEDGQSPPPWLGPVEEQDQVILVVTDTVLDDLDAFAEANPAERRQIDVLRNAPNSILRQCHQWGILEVLETKLHTQLIKLNGWERRAAELNISPLALKNFDFACVWESQIESTGRVLYVSGEEALVDFVHEAGATVDGVSRVAAMHVQMLDRAFASDREHGGHRLFEAAQKAKTSKFCGACLSAQLMQSLVIAPQLEEGPGAGVEQDPAKKALQEALELMQELRPLLAGRGAESAAFVERIDEAARKWQAVLGLQ